MFRTRSNWAVNTTAGILGKAQYAVRGYFDWHSAGQALPAQLIQLEGMHLISPDNEALSLSLVRAYVLYASGWVNDVAELAQQAGDLDLAAHHRSRAYLVYTRARDLALRVW